MIPKKNCISCVHFGWWDGDYCCTKLMKILQESPDGHFNDDILMALRINKDCVHHLQGTKTPYLEAFNEFLNNKEDDNV